jgi:hypothetical protein
MKRNFKNIKSTCIEFAFAIVFDKALISFENELAYSHITFLSITNVYYIGQRQ